MTHDELLAKLQKDGIESWDYSIPTSHNAIAALSAVVELHKPVIHALPDETCLACQDFYPCPTIQAIERELG